MLTFPNIDPILFKWGFIELRWYGLMYVVAFVLAFLLMKYEFKRRNSILTEDDIYDYLFFLILGVILGGRFGYIFFYNLDYYLSNPADMLKIYKGGMSFHGGFLGVVLTSYLFCRKKKISFLEMADVSAFAGSIGLGFGRLGNFINGELYGRETDPSFFMATVFPSDTLQLHRHPSQLYESFFEGFLMFGIIWFLSRKNLKPGSLLGTFIMLYGVFRFFIEYTREPDSHIGFVFAELSMGQILCFPMIIIGLALIIAANKMNINKGTTIIKNEKKETVLREGSSTATLPFIDDMNEIIVDNESNDSGPENKVETDNKNPT